jgi:hypothetical protein
VIYRFVRSNAAAPIDVQERDFVSDMDAIGWMGNEFLNLGEELAAYRGPAPEPFAQRQFSGGVEVFG